MRWRVRRLERYALNFSYLGISHFVEMEDPDEWQWTHKPGYWLIFSLWSSFDEGPWSNTWVLLVLSEWSLWTNGVGRRGRKGGVLFGLVRKMVHPSQWFPVATITKRSNSSMGIQHLARKMYRAHFFGRGTTNPDCFLP